MLTEKIDSMLRSPVPEDEAFNEVAQITNLYNAAANDLDKLLTEVRAIVYNSDPKQLNLDSLEGVVERLEKYKTVIDDTASKLYAEGVDGSNYVVKLARDGIKNRSKKLPALMNEAAPWKEYLENKYVYSIGDMKAKAEAVNAVKEAAEKKDPDVRKLIIDLNKRFKNLSKDDC